MNELMTRTSNIVAAEINSIKDQTRKMVLNNSIEIGRRLAEAKLMVSQGEWGQWLKDNVDYSPATARNLIRIFEEYGATQFSLFGDNTKSSVFENLTFTQAITLLSVPEDEREQFVKENDVENMSTRELQQVIKEKQELERKLRETEEQANREKAAREEIAKSYQELEKKTKVHDEIVEQLNKELDDAKSTGDDVEVEKLQTALEQSNFDLEKYRNRIKQLEEELNKKPIDVPTVTVEKIPEDIEKELLELRKKVKQQSSQPVIKFSYCFESLVNGFKDLLNALNEISEIDADSHEKYKKAVIGLIGKMTETL